MTILKGGQRTTSPLLDRIPFFDERSRRFAVSETPEVAQASAPRSYTWALEDEVLDQGSEGACVGFAFAHELAARPVEVASVSSATARYLYHEAQKIDPWPGGAYPGASPTYEGTAVLAGAKAVQAAGHYSEYRWSFSLDELVWGVGLRGPCVLGLNWYTGMFRMDAHGYIRPTGHVAGGHAILCRGVSLKRQEFLLANSWGPDWGGTGWGSRYYDGHCRMSFEDMGRLLLEDGEACFPTRKRAE